MKSNRVNKLAYYSLVLRIPFSVPTLNSQLDGFGSPNLKIIFTTNKCIMQPCLPNLSLFSVGAGLVCTDFVSSMVGIFFIYYVVSRVKLQIFSTHCGTFCAVASFYSVEHRQQQDIARVEVFRSMERHDFPETTTVPVIDI